MILIQGGSMATEVLKDRSYRIVGYLETSLDGKKVLKNSQYRILGYYNPHTNVTTDAAYKIVGYGNLLMTLINR